MLFKASSGGEPIAKDIVIDIFFWCDILVSSAWQTKRYQGQQIAYG
jgi:hypothetical protein